VIGTRLSKVEEAAKDAEQGAADTAATVGRLSGLADGLRSLVGGFRI
jgi:hypothetical protein